MSMLSSLRRLARPERIRVSLTDTGGGLPLPLASRRTWITGLAVGVATLVVASMAWQQLSAVQRLRSGTTVELVIAVLRWTGVVALWVGALALCLLAVALLLFRESARLADNRLIHLARLGPVRVFMDYDLASVKNLRAVGTGAEGARIRFDYGQRDLGLGTDMPLAEAEARVKLIQSAIDGLGARRASRATPVARPTPRP
jgi:hypothetical protein